MTQSPITIAAARALYPRSGGARAVGHDFDHVLRVLALAEQIGCAEGGDLAVIRTAALLHDLARARTGAGITCWGRPGRVNC